MTPHDTTMLALLIGGGLIQLYLANKWRKTLFVFVGFALFIIAGVIFHQCLTLHLLQEAQNITGK